MTLDEFHSEHDIGTRGGPHYAGLALAELKARRVPVEWFEAVAIIQELCDSLGAGGDPDKVLLGASAVFINPSGSVRAAQSAAEPLEPALRRVGELLGTSLAESAFPVPLRLVISQACSTPPFYASLTELSNALEYFERPDRRGLIRAVYERAQNHPPLSAAVTQDTPPVPATDNKPARPETRQPRRIPTAAVAASAAAGASIALLLVVSQLPTRQGGDGPVAAIVSSMGTLVDRVLPPAPESPTPSDPPPRPHSTRTGRTPTRSSPQRRTAAAAERRLVADVPPGDVPASETTAIAPVEALATATPVDAVPEATIYSASDPDVTPPIAAYPRLPAEPPARIPAGDLSTLELVVNASGQVESVKLHGEPRHLGEALLATVNLSAAKTWRFVPAVKEGRPVKYRTLVQVWPTTP